VSLLGSPFQHAIAPAVRKAANCLVSGSIISAGGGAGAVVAGATASVTVTSVDSYGNRYTTGIKLHQNCIASQRLNGCLLGASCGGAEERRRGGGEHLEQVEPN
jgi:hypothetical protein